MKLSLLLFISVMCVLALFGCQPAVSPNHFTGYVESEYFYIAAPQSGWIEKAYAIEGDAITPTQPFVQLDTQYQQLAVKQAQANVSALQAQLRDLQHGARQEEVAVLASLLEQQRYTRDEAALEVTRLQQLLSKNLASRSEFDKAALNLQALNAGIESIEHQIEVKKMAAREDYLQSVKDQIDAASYILKQALWMQDQRLILAHNSGVVEDIYYRQGEYVTQGQAIALVLLPETKKVRFYVEQGQIETIALNDNVSVRSDNGKVHNAKVTYIANRTEFTPPVLYSRKAREGLVFMVEAKFNKAVPLHVGQPVDVTLL